MHVDPARAFFHLTLERNGAAAVPFADFEAKQFVRPPRRLGCMGMLASPSDRNQVAPSEEQQVAVRDALASVGERHEMWLLAVGHGRWR